MKVLEQEKLPILTNLATLLTSCQAIIKIPHGLGISNQRDVVLATDVLE